MLTQNIGFLDLRLRRGALDACSSVVRAIPAIMHL